MQQKFIFSKVASRTKVTTRLNPGNNRMMHTRIILFLLISMFGRLWGATPIQAEEILELTVEGSSAATNPAAARQAIFDSVIQESSVKYILDIIGQQKYDHNKALIRGKILKNSGKYILSMKSTPPAKVGNGYTMNVTLKVSLRNLQALLLEEGLLYKMEGFPQILPMVSFQDRVNGQTYSWWVSEAGADASFILNQNREFLNKMRSSFRERGFFCLFPLGRGYRNMMPSTFFSENPRTEDYLFVGEFFEAQIVTKGYIRYGKARSKPDAYQIDVKIVAIHSGNGRIVGEVVRTYETESGPFQTSVQRKANEVLDTVTQDLSIQIFDAWKRGTFGANLLRLTVNGRLNYLQMSELKKAMLEQVRDIRSLKERFFETNRVIFEVDASSGIRQIGSILEKQGLKPFRISVSKITSDSLEIDVQTN